MIILVIYNYIYEIEVASFISSASDVAGTDEEEGKEQTPKGFISAGKSLGIQLRAV